MADEVLSTTASRSEKSEIKLSGRKNVIPITSLSDLGTVVGEIQNQLSLLIEKLNDEVSPEFKALMEGFVNKANEAEELKVNIENTKNKYDELQAELTQIRSTNRNLIQELQSARETLRVLESQFNTFQAATNKAEEENKNKIELLTKHKLEYENKVKQLEIEKEELKQCHEEQRQALLDQNFNLRQNENELMSHRDNLKKQVDEFELLLKEQQEQIELRTKELEYKDALFKELIKQATLEKLKPQVRDMESNEDKQQKRKKGFWPFNFGT